MKIRVIIGIFLISGNLMKFAIAKELEEAWYYFLSGRYNISEKIVDSCLKTDEISPQIYYLKALLLLKGMRIREARKFFEELAFYGGKWSEYAFIGKADAFYLEGKFKNAGLIYSAFLKRYPESELIPEVIYKYGLCLRKQGRWEDAKAHLQKLGRDYPYSLPATYARKLIQENEFFFTIQVGSFLNYDNAYALARKLKSQGYEAYIKKTEYKGKLYYRVRVGRFQNREQMKPILKELLSQGCSIIIYP